MMKRTTLIHTHTYTHTHMGAERHTCVCVSVCAFMPGASGHGNDRKQISTFMLYELHFGREILKGISNFEKAVPVKIYTQKNAQIGSKGSNLGPSGSLLGTFWIILKHFRPSVGPLGAPHGHP